MAHNALMRPEITALFDNQYFDPIPIPSGEKGPRTDDWQTKSFTPESFDTDNNVGTRLGIKLVDVDCDCPEAIEAADLLLPNTGLVYGRKSARRAHRFYAPRTPIKSRQFKDVDTRDEDGRRKAGKMIIELRGQSEKGVPLQTMIPPSVHPGTQEPLVWETLDGQPGIPGHADAELLPRFVAYVAVAGICSRHWPGSGHLARLALAGYLLKAGVEEAIALKILAAVTRITKGAAGDFTDAETAVRTTAATLKRQEAVSGRRELAEQLDNGDEVVKRLDRFLDIEDAVRADQARQENEARIDETNKHFAIMSVGAKVLVAEFGDDREIVELWPFEEFRKLLIKEPPAFEGKKQLPFADYWLSHPKGGHFRQLVYAMPGGLVQPRPGDYDGWHGFKVVPSPGSWEKNKAHLLNVICAGDAGVFEWLLNWCAALVQSPGRHAWAAIVLRGGQGAGKGHFADHMLGALFHRQQYAHLVGANQLTGQFNEHLSGKALVFADEATWGGDKQAAGVLKALVTENTVPIHRKFLKQVEELSAMHIVIASNNEWPVPVEWDDRRFLVLDVDDGRKNDAVYFEPLRRELADGGLAAMLHELLARPIDERALRNPPDTKGKRDLKALSFSAEDRWLQDWLMDERGDWRTRVSRAETHEAYKTSLSRNQTPKSIDGLGKFLSRMFKRANERGVRDVAAYPRTVKLATNTGRVNGWEFPPLAACRRAFDLATGASTAWPPDDREAAASLLDEQAAQPEECPASGF